MAARTLTDIKQEIASYMKLSTRNRIVFGKQRIEGIQYLDVGKFVAGLLWSHSQATVSQRLLSYPQKQDETFGPYLALENIGILFEPELKIDLRNLLDGLSKNQCLIIHSNAEISENTFWWLSSSDGISLSLQDFLYRQF